MNDAAERILSLARLLATARVRRFAVHQPNYRGRETVETCEARVEHAMAELRAAVEEVCRA